MQAVKEYTARNHPSNCAPQRDQNGIWILYYIPAKPRSVQRGELIGDGVVFLHHRHQFVQCKNSSLREWWRNRGKKGGGSDHLWLQLWLRIKDWKTYQPWIKPNEIKQDKDETSPSSFPFPHHPLTPQYQPLPPLQEGDKSIQSIKAISHSIPHPHSKQPPIKNRYTAHDEILSKIVRNFSKSKHINQTHIVKLISNRLNVLHGRIYHHEKPPFHQSITFINSYMVKRGQSPLSTRNIINPKPLNSQPFHPPTTNPKNPPPSPLPPNPEPQLPNPNPPSKKPPPQPPPPKILETQPTSPFQLISTTPVVQSSSRPHPHRPCPTHGIVNNGPGRLSDLGIYSKDPLHQSLDTVVGSCIPCMGRLRTRCPGTLYTFLLCPEWISPKRISKRAW